MDLNDLRKRLDLGGQIALAKSLRYAADEESFRLKFIEASRRFAFFIAGIVLLAIRPNVWSRWWQAPAFAVGSLVAWWAFRFVGVLILVRPWQRALEQKLRTRFEPKASHTETTPGTTGAREDLGA